MNEFKTLNIPRSEDVDDVPQAPLVVGWCPKCAGEMVLRQTCVLDYTDSMGYKRWHLRLVYQCSSPDLKGKKRCFERVTYRLGGLAVCDGRFIEE